MVRTKAHLMYNHTTTGAGSSTLLLSDVERLVWSLACWCCGVVVLAT